MTVLGLESKQVIWNGRMGIIWQAVFVFVLSSWISAPVNCEEKTLSTLARLRKDILRDYDRNTCPTIDKSLSTIVSVFMYSKYIPDLDERRHTFTMEAWIHMVWQDDRAKWKPEEYEDVKTIIFDQEELWTPRMIILWSSPTSSIDPQARSPMTVDYSGRVVWYPAALFRTQCVLDYTNYPNDQQKCSFNITALSYHGQMVDLYTATSEVNTNYLANTNPKWTLVSTEIVKSNEWYKRNLFYTFVLKRRMPFGGDVEWALSIVAFLLTLSMFWMPPERGKKLTIGLTSLLILFGELLFFTLSSPSPEIALYTARMIQQAVYAVLSAIVFEIIVLNFTRITEFPPPGVLLDLLSGPARKFFCFCPQDPKKTTLQKDWYIIALGCDRILFVLYIVVFISLKTWV